MWFVSARSTFKPNLALVCEALLISPCLVPHWRPYTFLYFIVGSYHKLYCQVLSRTWPVAVLSLKYIAWALPLHFFKGIASEAVSPDGFR